MEYFTDASVVNGYTAMGFIPRAGNSFKRAIVFQNPNMNIHHGELAAIKMCICDIAANYDPNEYYEINTDSDTAVSIIQSNSSKYSEVNEINNILQSTNNISLRIVKSHSTPKEQKLYLKEKGEIVSRKKAFQITNGNNKIDSIVNAGANIKTLPIYNPTPWSIKV